MKLLLALALLLFPIPGLGVELRDLSLEYRYFKDDSRHLELPQEKAKEGLSLNMNLGWGPVVWENTIESLTTSGQYRYIAWRFLFGLEYQRFQVGLEHKSGHILDTFDDQFAHGRFPMRNGLLVRIPLH